MAATGILRFSLLLAAWLALTALLLPAAARADGSTFGAVSIPAPASPARAENCVEPVEIMRREHMHLLDRQRDRTVIDGERDGKYSLVGCMDCHNPVDANGQAASYGDEQHFCSECHAYASVRIDCFECHADRGYGAAPGNVSSNAWDDGSALTAATLRHGLETADAD
jgi:hypothetical protein